MPKLTLANLANLNNETSAVNTINANSDLIETALENTLSRDGTLPNSMAADLDMDSNDILNVGNIEAATIEATTIDADSFTVDGISINVLLLDWEGQWVISTAYIIGDLVEDNGSSFICTVPHTATDLNRPGFGVNWEDVWDLVAQKGDPGLVAVPASSTDNAIVRFDGTLGNSFQNSEILIDDNGNLLPGTADGSALGSTTLPFSDIALADGAVTNYNNGELTATHEDVSLILSSAGQTTLALRSTGGQPSIEMGRVDGNASTPFIDFHSGATAVDYDARIIASGGTGVLGGGGLSVTAASVSLGTTTPLTVGTIELGAASDTTISRTGAGSIAVEGNNIYRAGGTDVPVTDGGSGRSDSTAYAVICGGTTSTAAHQSIASVGTSGHVLTSNGAGALPTFQASGSAVVTIVTAGAISAAATLDIVLGSDDMYEIDLISIVPATDNTALYARFSQSSSFLSGAADYAWGYHSFDSRVSDASDSEIQMAAAWGNVSTEVGSFTIRVFRPSAAAFRKSMRFQGGLTSTAGEPLASHGHGYLLSNTNAIDGVQFLFSTGNIATGFYAVRSYRFT